MLVSNTVATCQGYMKNVDIQIVVKPLFQEAIGMFMNTGGYVHKS
jgi:hypothetical protein